MRGASAIFSADNSFGRRQFASCTAFISITQYSRLSYAYVLEFCTVKDTTLLKSLPSVMTVAQTAQ